MSEENTKALTINRKGAVETIFINDAPRNRMSLAFMDQLELEIARIAEDKTVRAVIIRGSGHENFSVGMDLKQLPQGIKEKGSIEAVFDQRLRVLNAIEQLSKPVIAVMYGYCLGGGLELPLACHFRFAAKEDAHIGLPEMDLGTVPAWGGSARLTRQVGRSHALDMILRGKKISGPQALKIGLVNEVYAIDELFEKAEQLAQELASQPATAIAGVLRCVVSAETESKTLEQSLKDEREAVMATMGSADQMEGMTAFMEKRKPHFNKS